MVMPQILLSGGKPPMPPGAPASFRSVILEMTSDSWLSAFYGWKKNLQARVLDRATARFREMGYWPLSIPD
jgi:hypothetical protein